MIYKIRAWMLAAILSVVVLMVAVYSQSIQTQAYYIQDVDYIDGSVYFAVLEVNKSSKTPFYSHSSKIKIDRQVGFLLEFDLTKKKYNLLSEEKSENKYYLDRCGIAFGKEGVELVVNQKMVVGDCDKSFKLYGFSFDKRVALGRCGDGVYLLRSNAGEWVMESELKINNMNAIRAILNDGRILNKNDIEELKKSYAVKRSYAELINVAEVSGKEYYLFDDDRQYIVSGEERFDLSENIEIPRHHGRYVWDVENGKFYLPGIEGDVELIVYDYKLSTVNSYLWKR